MQIFLFKTFHTNKIYHTQTFVNDYSFSIMFFKKLIYVVGYIRTSFLLSNSVLYGITSWFGDEVAPQKDIVPHLVALPKRIKDWEDTNLNNGCC